MNEKIARIEHILKSKFQKDDFELLVKELLDNVDLHCRSDFKEEKSNFSSHIESSAHIADYEDPEGKSIVIYAVKLKDAQYVENSRSTQRNYAKSIIDGNNYDAAIVAYFMDTENKWRLSFVRLDYEIKFEQGKLNTEEKLTPAKRYSFLVGEGEPCHTAIKQLANFIENDNYRPTIDEIEEAFGVERVTKEFYKLYCEKYHQLQEHLVGNREFIEEAERLGFDCNAFSVQFSKKLMGQIVFMYFLQKKGWLGVNVYPREITEREYEKIFYAKSPLGDQIKSILPHIYQKCSDSKYKLNSVALRMLPEDLDIAIAHCIKRQKNWGDGPQDFMRRLFIDAEARGLNFFDKYLEPLFYDAMNKNRGESGYFSTLHCRIPFLSGGLFEPIDGYDWKHTDFNIPNDIFSNANNENQYEADGILDIFDRYNFTISEDEPLEREVAIDPEMLGKVFENLLEIKDRKSKGAFYTPREVVHYMCQETLIDYLIAKTDLPKEDIRNFVLYGDFMKDEDTVKIRGRYKTKMFIPESIFKCNSDGSRIVDRLSDIDKALSNVKIADPAVGSGAFPLGLLNEIVKIRQTITSYMSIGMSSFNKRNLYVKERSTYALKRNTIKDCIFAVDIDPSAVDIARLRLWLALVIDDIVVSDGDGIFELPNPTPLPNLDCNIICGNSLVDEFMGIPLINKAALKEDAQQNLGQEEYEYYLSEIVKTQDELYQCDDNYKKERLKRALAALRTKLIMQQLSNEGATTSIVKAIGEAEKCMSKPYVLWPIDFAKAFKDNGGFDIVIGNPPYIAEEGNKDLFRSIAKTDFGKKYYIGKMDFWYFFTSKGIELLSSNGLLSFIAPNNWMTTAGGKKMRAHISNECKILDFITFNNTLVFDSVSQQTMIFLLRKYHSEDSYYVHCKEVGSQNLDGNQLKVFLRGSSIGKNFYALYDPVVHKDGSTVQFLDRKITDLVIKIKQNASTYLKNDEVINGIHPHHACVTKKMLSVLPDAKVGDGIFIISAEEVSLLHFNEKELQLLRPYYDTTNISRYYFDDINTKWIIYTSSEFKNPSMMQGLSNIKLHLDRYEKVITSDNRPYGLHRARKQSFFDNPSIASLRKCKIPTFSYLEKKSYLTAEWYIINTSRISLKYLTCLLNSELIKFWLLEMGKMQGTNYQVDKEPLINIPIKECSDIIVKKMETLCEEIYSRRRVNKDVDINDLEERINMIVYDIYCFNADDIRNVKNIIKEWENK